MRPRSIRICPKSHIARREAHSAWSRHLRARTDRHHSCTYRHRTPAWQPYSNFARNDRCSCLRSRDVRSRPRGVRDRRQAFDRHLFARAFTRRRHTRASPGRAGCCVGSAASLACSQRVETSGAPGHREALSRRRKGCPRRARSRSMTRTDRTSVADARYLDLQRKARQTSRPADELIQLYVAPGCLSAAPHDRGTTCSIGLQHAFQAEKLEYSALKGISRQRLESPVLRLPGPKGESCSAF
jgi:hypothetical protein